MVCTVTAGEEHGCTSPPQQAGERMQEQIVGAPSAALRIVCLFQGAVDAVCALGLQSCLVGRSHHCTGPASVLSLPCISTLDSKAMADTSPLCNVYHQSAFDCYKINWNLLQELKPDLIFSNAVSRVDKQFAQCSQELAERKCRLVYLQSHSVEDILQNVETIASCCGATKEGTKLAMRYRTQWKSVKQNTPQWADGMPLVNAGFLSSVNPLIGAGYWIPEIINYAGGLSAFGVMGLPSKPLILEDLSKTNPDVLLYLTFELHSGSLATELSWLFTNKDWLNLKAIKANRFFLIDANKFFVDSAPNVISSTELLTEIFHGFGYGHEGKGFVRWQCFISTKLEHDSMILQDAGFRDKLPALMTNKSTSENSMLIDMHEIRSSASQDYPKYVTSGYEARKPARELESGIPCCNLRRKPDVWDEELVVLDTEKDDVLMHAFGEECVLDRQTCFDTKILTPDKVFQLEDTYSVSSKELAMDWHGNREMWAVEGFSHNAKYRESAQVPLCQVKLNDNGDQKGRNAGLRPVQVHDFPAVSPHHLPRQHGLCRTASSVDSHGIFMGSGYCDKQLMSKIWAFTESAAEMRSRSPSQSPSFIAEQRFQKSVSLPVSHCSRTKRGVKNELCLSAEFASRTNSFSAIEDDEKPLVEVLAKEPYESNVKREARRAVQSLTARKDAKKPLSNEILKRHLSHSVPSSPKLDIVTRVSKHLRDLVFKSLIDLEHLDCLLLSGGLASSLLAEAVPLVQTKGFRVGYTVVAGPAATERASAAVAAKCNGMQHLVIGEGERGFAVFLLAKELSFIVEILKTFDPFQVRNMVPIAAALREAKNHGIEHVVTGDGLDGLLFRDSISKSNEQFCLAQVLSRSAVLLGEALGVKVIQPFLQPKLVQECKSLIRSYGLRSKNSELIRSTLREAFPEVSATCHKKSFNEVDSGMFYVSDYFSSAISVSVLESKAKHIFEKDRIRIRNAEHLVYYRAFRKVFKGKVPKDMLHWASRPCSACGYQLSTAMPWYCLVCGLSPNAQQLPMAVEQFRNKRHEKLATPEEANGRQSSSNVGSQRETCKGPEVSDQKQAIKATFLESVGRENVISSQHANSETHMSDDAYLRSHASKFVSKKPIRRRRETPMPQEKRPNFWALLGAGSAGLLLLLQLSKR